MTMKKYLKTLSVISITYKEQISVKKYFTRILLLTRSMVILLMKPTSIIIENVKNANAEIVIV